MQAVLWFLRSFRKLQWRLTLSYLLVTLVVVLAVEVVNTFTDTATVTQAEQSDALAQTLSNVVVPHLEPYMISTPLDRSAMTSWAMSFVAPTNPSKQEVAGTLSGKYVLLVVLNQNGQVLASAPDDANMMSKLFQNNAQSQALVLDALRNAPATRAHVVGGLTYIALSVKGIGAFFTVYTGPPPQSFPLAKGSFPAVLWANLSSEFPLLALAGVIGLLSGMLGSRGIRQPLRRIAFAADAWSRGDFSVKTRATSRDELGQLARDLNSMADQLQALLTTRQELAVVEERHRLARDLHDSIKQQMFVITLLV